MYLPKRSCCFVYGFRCLELNQLFVVITLSKGKLAFVCVCVLNKCYNINIKCPPPSHQTHGGFIHELHQNQFSF